MQKNEGKLEKKEEMTRCVMMRESVGEAKK